MTASNNPSQPSSPSPMPPKRDQKKKPSPTESTNEEAKHKTTTAVQTGSSLAALLFIATFLGSLLGVVADLSDASGLALPVIEAVNPSPQLRIAGSNTVLGDGLTLASEWQAMFAEQKKETLDIPVLGDLERTANISVQGVGSLEGFQQAAEGQVDLLVTSEPMTDAQLQTLQQNGINITCASEIGYDIITFVTDVNNPVPQISTRDMASILNGSITNWAQVGGNSQPIRVLARRGSGTTDLVLQNFTGDGRFRDRFVACESNATCLDTTLSTLGALYWVSTAWLKTQPPRYLRPILTQRGNLPVQDPLSETFDPNEYTDELVRPLYMYVLSGEMIAPESTLLAKEFLQMVRGVRGQEMLEMHHFYTHFDPPGNVQTVYPPGFGPSIDGIPIVCR